MFTRFNGNVVPFADDATSTNRTVFGGTTQSDLIDDNLNTNFKKGWEIVGLNDNPTREDFNGMGYTLGALTAYLYEMGISEWNASQNYRTNSRVTGSDGKIYKSLTGTTGIPNVGKNPTTDAVNWQVENITDYSSLTNKTTPIDADLIPLSDSASSFGLKKLSWANLKSTLKTYFDTLYNLYNPTPIIATGTATFTATTNNINLTGIGIGIEIGDVIQISGATDAKNNSEFTVEVITDNDNIIVNQAHANKGTTKNVADRSGDTRVTVKLLSKWYNAPLGLGQDWVNMTASRALTITYPNNTNRAFAINLTSTLGPANVNVTINNLLVYGWGTVAGININTSTGNVIIPNKATYLVAMSNVGISLWLELR